MRSFVANGLSPTELRQVADIFRFYAVKGVPTESRAEFDEVLLRKAHKLVENELNGRPRRARRKELAKRLEVIEAVLEHIAGSKP